MNRSTSKTALLTSFILVLTLGWTVFAAPAHTLAAASSCNESHCDLIDTYVNPLINVLSAVFGTIAAGSIIMGGIQYSASEGDPQKASKAKNRIANTIFAIFAYALLYGFLEFLVPGGFFNR